MHKPYDPNGPSREEVDAFSGATLLEFGNDWCGHCGRAQPLIAEALNGADIRHVKIADSAGKRLGRSFGVKLWPTLVFLKDGVELARAVRPRDLQEIRAALEKVDQRGATPDSRR